MNREGHIEIMEVIMSSDRIDFTEVSYMYADDYLRMVNDMDNVGRFIGKKEPIKLSDSIKFIHSCLTYYLASFTMFEAETSEFIGSIDLREDSRHRAEFGIAICTEKQNKGYGREAINKFIPWAFAKFDLSEIWLKVYNINPRAKHVYELCGFIEYGYDNKAKYMAISRKGY